MTKHLLVGAALLLAGSSSAWAQSATAAVPTQPGYQHSYDAAGMNGATGHDNLMGIPAYVSPNDPTYSYFEPVHRGQASESSAANSSWNGPYTQLGHDSGM
jgi:hypothetical protein